MKNKKFFLVLILISSSLYSQRYDSIQFENILKTISAKDLFFKKIIEKDDIEYVDETNQNLKYNSIEAFEKFQNTRYASQIDLNIEKNNKLLKIGKGYGIDMYAESEKVFTYEELNFNRFILFSNIKHQVIAYKLFNNKEKESNIKKFIEKNSKLFKNEITTNDNGEKEHYFYLNDRTIILVMLNNSSSSSVSVVSPYDEKPKETELNIELKVIYKNLSKDEELFLKKM